MKRTLLHNARISASMKKAWREERTTGFRGKHHTPEARKRISEYVKDNPIYRPPGYHQKERHPQWKKKNSPEQVENHRQFMVNWWEEHRKSGKIVDKEKLVNELEDWFNKNDVTYMSSQDFDLYIPDKEIVITIYNTRSESTSTDSRNKWVLAKDQGHEHVAIFPDNIVEVLEGFK